MKFDLVVKGGKVLDPGKKISKELDIGISGEKIAAIDKNIDSEKAKKVIDAAGKIVTPGLIDMHTHVNWLISRSWLDPDSVAPYSGVTAMVDVASANYDSWPGFKRFIVDKSQTRVYSFINASPYPLESPREHPNPIESDLGYLYNSVLLIKSNSNIIKGVKTFAGYNNEKYPDRVIELALEITYHAKVPLMLHISFAPPRIEEVLPLLRKGDILTHSFTGHTQRIIDGNGKLRPEARDAIDRGVLLDIGHGMGSFSFRVAKDLLKQGVKPFTISTDLHSGCIHGPTYDLPTTLSKFLNLGLSLEDVILRATAHPAEILKGPKGLGSLEEGGVADIAILKIKKGEFEYMDAHKWILHGDQKIFVTNTITRGKVMEEIVKTRYPPYQGKHSTVPDYTIS